MAGPWPRTLKESVLCGNERTGRVSWQVCSAKVQGCFKRKDPESWKDSKADTSSGSEPSFAELGWCQHAQLATRCTSKGHMARGEQEHGHKRLRENGYEGQGRVPFHDRRAAAGLWESQMYLGVLSLNLCPESLGRGPAGRDLQEEAREGAGP